MRRLILFCSLCLFCSTAAFAQQIKLNQGDQDITFSAAFNSGELGADLRWGRFFQDYFQYGVEIGYADDDFVSQTGIGLYLLRYFETNTYTIPYLGVGLGYGALSSDANDEVDFSGGAFALIFGIRYYIADNVAINTELRGAAGTDDIFIDGSEGADSDFSLNIGFTYLW